LERRPAAGVLSVPNRVAEERQEAAAYSVGRSCCFPARPAAGGVSVPIVLFWSAVAPMPCFRRRHREIAGIDTRKVLFVPSCE